MSQFNTNLACGYATLRCLTYERINGDTTLCSSSCDIALDNCLGQIQVRPISKECQHQERARTNLENCYQACSETRQNQIIDRLHRDFITPKERQEITVIIEVEYAQCGTTCLTNTQGVICEEPPLSIIPEENCRMEYQRCKEACTSRPDTQTNPIRNPKS